MNITIRLSANSSSKAIRNRAGFADQVSPPISPSRTMVIPDVSSGLSSAFFGSTFRAVNPSSEPYRPGGLSKLASGV